MEAFGMGKDLSKMTLEELWALFPIFLVPHDDRWKDSFNEINYDTEIFISKLEKALRNNLFEKACYMFRSENALYGTGHIIGRMMIMKTALLLNTL